MKQSIATINRRRSQRRARSHAKLFGTATKPRLTVFRSNRYLYAQLIDDDRGVTLVSASTREAEGKGSKATKTVQAGTLGEAIASRAAALQITTVVFDKGAYRYHGRVRAVAEGARKGGLKI